MKALKYIFFVLLILIIGAAIYIAVQPNSYAFERSRVIKAPTPVAYNIVNDYKEWPRFSPWIEKDENAEINYGEKTVGEGANYSWDGDVLKAGNMMTENTVSNTSIKQQINFTDHNSSATINWTFKPVERGTKVTWGMSGEQDFMTKAMVALSGPVEESLGPDFERGLNKLDSIARADISKFNISVNGLTQYSGGFYLYTSASTKMDNMTSKMQQLMSQVRGFAEENNVSVAGNPFVIYHKLDEQNNAVVFSYCIPTTSQVIVTESDILTGQIEPFKAVKTTLEGSYDNLQPAWDKAMAYVEDNNLELPENGMKIETYVTDPMNTPNPAKWLTEIYLEIE